jgi:beta-mannosidase
MPIVISASLLSGERIIYSEVQCHKGELTVTVPFTLKNPQLWWCNGQGPQPLYEFHFDITGANGQSIVRRVKTGIRTISLVQQPDSAGSSFYFSLNGKPVFIKGANYVPQDVFLNRVTPQQYRTLLAEVKNCGMNMLRVWGGGIYEKDIFYDLADSLGILIWQDFMFACGMYPSGSAFLLNVEAEARHQVLRLSGHPSLALWCGNNEVSEGWHRWGWQNAYSQPQRDSLWNGYKIIFRKVLPETVNRFSGLAYHESSPALGRGDSLHTRTGDAHNWFVWHDEQPFSNFEVNVPRFMSEFGFQSLPAFETIERFGGAGAPDNAALRFHQRHHRGFDIINNYMLRRFGFIPSELGGYIRLSQQLQAEGMITGIKAHLAARPYCMGTLLWQLNDCWPGISWSMMDYYGLKKEVWFKVCDWFKSE